MYEITKIHLENEMDLILAHRQSMKLAEAIGLTISAQTTFATAVSEVSRNLIDAKTNAFLQLNLSGKKEEPKYIIAQLHHGIPNSPAVTNEGLGYARRLLHDVRSSYTEESTLIELKYKLPAFTHINDELIERWRIHLNNDPAVSPYEEIKRKNRLLVEISEQLKQSEYQYKTLADSLPIMIFTLDNAGRIIYANKWMLEYTGKTVAVLNDADWARSLGITAADEHDDVAEHTFEQQVVQGDSGESRWHTGVLIGVNNADGTLKYRNAFLVDIHAQKMVEQTLKDNSELKHIQKVLEEKIDLLNKSNNQLEQFAYVASHDLQEPLRKISYYTDYLKTYHSKDLPEGNALRYLDNLNNATARMRTLINDILLYSTTNTVDNSFSGTDLNTVMEHTLSDLEMAIELSGAQISCDTLPVIEGNFAQLKQLFENLISNSIKYAQENTPPEINISVVTEAGQVTIAISDKGIGFDMAFVDKMFALFQRLHTRDKYEGTGIGLALCKKIVEYHHGTISAQGEVGAGATFTITLPLTQSAEH